MKLDFFYEGKMKFIKLIFALALSQNALAQDDQPRAACQFAPSEDGVRCGGGSGPSYQTQAQHNLFLETLALTQTSPEFSGIVSAVRVNIEWAIVDRSAEKKDAPKPGQSVIDKVLSLGSRALGISASFSFTYTTTGYDAQGRPITTSIDISAGAATGGAAAAQASMNEAMQKNKK